MGFEYNSVDSREGSIDELVAKGRFRVAVKKKTAIIIGGAGIAGYVWLFALASKVNNFLDPVTMTDFHLKVSQVLMLMILPFYFGIVIALLSFGREYNYRADGKVFVVTSKGIPDEYFFYKNVNSVTYKEMKFLLFVRGYKVEISTNHGVTTYNYVFPGILKHQPAKNLPFEVIRERIQK